MSTVLAYTGVVPTATQDALSRVLGEAQSLGTDELLMPNLDMEGAVLTVLGAVSRARPYLADLRQLPGLRVEGIEALQDYAMALAAANVRVRTASAPRSELPGLLARASQWRWILSSEAETLSLRGLIPPGSLARVRSRLQRARGYKSVAFDLMALAQFFTDAWPVIAGRTGLAATEVHDAFALGLELMEAAPKSKNAPDPRAAAVELRARVFTLLHRAYAELRQGMKYLRWREGDADRIVPSLYQRSPTARRAARRVSSPRDASVDAGRAPAADASVDARRARAANAAPTFGEALGNDVHSFGSSRCIEETTEPRGLGARSVLVHVAERQAPRFVDAARGVEGFDMEHRCFGIQQLGACSVAIAGQERERRSASPLGECPADLIEQGDLRRDRVTGGR